MRTTLDIDSDVLESARELARLKNQGLGRALSDLARIGLAVADEPVIEYEHGIPVWKARANAVQVTSELVRNLLDEE